MDKIIVFFDGKHLTKEQTAALLEYYHACTEPRRREFLAMFFFAFHACGLRVVDVMTLQWKHIDFARQELRKILIKMNKHHVIPRTEPACTSCSGGRRSMPDTGMSSIW